MRREFPTKVMVAAFERAAGKCESCGARLSPGKFAYDHVIPDALGGSPTIENCAVLCSACHGAKTARQDVPQIAKMKRQRAVHLGIKKPTKFRRPAGYKFNWSTGRYVKETA